MRHTTPRALALFALLSLLAFDAFAQQTKPRAGANPAPKASASPAQTQTPGDASGDGDEVRRELREQREEIERLRTALTEQTRLIEELRVRVEQTAAQTTAATMQATQKTTRAEAAEIPVAFKDTLRASRDVAAPGGDAPTATRETQSASSSSSQAAKSDERLSRVEEELKKTSEVVTRQLGSISFSGDIRFRYESFYGQLNASPSDSDPTVLGNPLSTRQRFRIRARLGLRGQITKEFDWGLRMTTGSFPDVISPNQTLTDFYSHKNFALDQAYISYKPSFAPGLQIQAGKFDVPWVRTEMTLDNDLTPEGLYESYTRSFKKSPLKSLTFIAWQLPFLERASAFVLGADGRVDFEQSRRAGRDLALYGGQLRAQFEPTAKSKLTLSAADLYFSGTQFITPAQFFGSGVQIPVTVRIPATATTPAQTVVAQVIIPRDQLVSGNANLGISTGTNNAVNRDGRLASGYNLVDLIGRLELTHSKRWPVMLLLNFVTNTQAHDVVVAGAGGANVLQENNENQGYWAELQVGKNQQRGDWLLNYAFIRIEKDAVLTPFNGSDLGQQSDSRIQRFIVAYSADPRVTLSLAGIFTSRPNGLLGVFGTTPQGSLNRPTTRLQLDTVFRF